YEFDPYFGLSISRVDPLPHQLEAVYDYLLKSARVRFLLADDAGAGKTIMSGLLIRELELRGLAERILIVCLANLAFQWQPALQAGRATARHLRPHAVAHGHPAQGRSSEFQPVPAAPRRRRLRRRQIDPPGDGPPAGTVLPPPYQGGDGLLPRTPSGWDLGRR